MSFLPGSLTPALLRSCHRKVISHSDGHSVVGCRKTKRADYTEHQKSAGAWLSLQSDVLCNRLWKFKVGFCFLPAPANRTKGVVEQFGTPGVPIPCRIKPTYGGTLVFSCTTIIQIHHLSVKFLKVSHYIRNFKEQFSTGPRKDPSTG